MFRPLTPEELAAFARNAREHYDRMQAEDARELAAGKCRRCGAPLSALWKDGIVDSHQPDAVIFRCLPCLEAELERET